MRQRARLPSRRQLGDAELAGRDIDMRQPRPVAVQRDRGQVVVLVRPQQVRVGRGARRDDAGDLALDQLLARTRGSSICSQMATR